MKGCRAVILAVAISVLAAPALSGQPGTSQPRPSVDATVRAFLAKMAHRWRDMNVPAADGELLYNIVLSHNYTRALEVGTSTGLSGIYIAWALSKTGGRLVTIEIDPDRQAEAVGNFREAGLAAFIDARLADAHELAAKIPGPFDFVFLDADKDWYENYARAVIPKLVPGGCLAAHNVFPSRGGWGGGTAGYFEYLKSLPEFDSRILGGGSGSLSVSYKIK